MKNIMRNEYISLVNHGLVLYIIVFLFTIMVKLFQLGVVWILFD